MKYRGAKYVFADLGKIGGLLYAPLKSLSLGFEGIGFRKTSQCLDIAANVLPYGSLMYASLTPNGIPNENYKHKLTRFASLFLTGAFFIPGLVSSISGYGDISSPNQEAPKITFEGWGGQGQTPQSSTQTTELSDYIAISVLSGFVNTIPMAFKRGASGKSLAERTAENFAERMEKRRQKKQQGGQK